MTEHVYHLAMPEDWAAAERAGSYTTSTRGMTLDEVGFIHLSRAEQWPATRERFYRDVDELVLLTVDVSGLDVRVEVGDPTTGELFPHLYEPLPVERVVHVEHLRGHSAHRAG